jgi:hypothetical protein
MEMTLSAKRRMNEVKNVMLGRKGGICHGANRRSNLPVKHEESRIANEAF